MSASRPKLPRRAASKRESGILDLGRTTARPAARRIRACAPRTRRWKLLPGVARHRARRRGALRETAVGPGPRIAASKRAPQPVAHATEHDRRVRESIERARPCRAERGGRARRRRARHRRSARPTARRPFRIDPIPRRHRRRGMERALGRGGPARTRARAVRPRRLRRAADRAGRRGAGPLPRRTPGTTSARLLGMGQEIGSWITVAGLDVVRDSDGSFKVLEDNLRTPSGHRLRGSHTRGAGGAPAATLAACACARWTPPSRRSATPCARRRPRRQATIPWWSC